MVLLFKKEAQLKIDSHGKANRFAWQSKSIRMSKQNDSRVEAKRFASETNRFTSELNRFAQEANRFSSEPNRFSSKPNRFPPEPNRFPPERKRFPPQTNHHHKFLIRNF